MAYGATKEGVEAHINLMQLQLVDQPLPRSIWKLIIQDQYTNFKKSYDHRDEEKDFGDGYTLDEKDHAHARKPLRGEADWLRVYNAWRKGTLLLYSH